jgi:hypothetical protein
MAPGGPVSVTRTGGGVFRLPGGRGLPGGPPVLAERRNAEYEGALRYEFWRQAS